ncbi:MAG: hypothetical protein QM438_00215 [Euryarchaeota archaeon]|nr:hypothetical protein [Euryarchaeota archaeon]
MLSAKGAVSRPPLLCLCGQVMDLTAKRPERRETLGSAMPCDLAVSQKIFSALQYHFTLQ